MCVGDIGIAVPPAPTLCDYMLRRYCPPTSYKAFEICPSEQQRTASIITANTFWLSITACFSLARQASDCPALRVWKSLRRGSFYFFSPSVERSSSILLATPEPCGLRKVLTPMMGKEPSCFLCS